MARPLVLASSNGATTGPAAAQAHVRSSSPSCGAAGCGVATPVSGTALAGAAGGAAAAPLALPGTGGNGLNVGAEAAATVVVVVVVVTVLPGATSPAGGITRSTWPTSRWFGSARLFQRGKSRPAWAVSMPILVSMSPGWTVYVVARPSAAADGGVAAGLVSVGGATG